METLGRTAATPDAVDFTVENVEKVSFRLLASCYLFRYWHGMDSKGDRVLYSTGNLSELYLPCRHNVEKSKIIYFTVLVSGDVIWTYFETRTEWLILTEKSDESLISGCTMSTIYSIC